MGNLGDSLQKSINRLGISRQVTAVGVVERATTEIAKYIPREEFEVISFNRGTLKVGVVSAAIASELQLSANKIKSTISDIKKIRALNNAGEVSLRRDNQNL